MIAGTLQEQMSKSIKYIQPLQLASATGVAAEAFQQMQSDFMPVPLLTLHSPVPEVMAGVWSILRETLLAEAPGSPGVRVHKEVVAATVSKSNECSFCVDAHTTMLHASSEHDVAGAILRGDYDSIRDPELHSLVQWVLARRTAFTHNAPPPPFSYATAPEIIGTAITFHYINRMVNVFLGDSLLPVPATLKGLTRRVLAAAAGKWFVRNVQPGTSLRLVPRAELPGDLAWAVGNPAVAGAFAGFAAVVEEAGKRVLPEPVRALVSAHLQAWNGEAMGMSRRWVEKAVNVLEVEHRAAARLALLTALASYQVDEGIVERFQVQYPSDDQLIAATAWASFSAARRVSVWFAEPLIVAGREAWTAIQ